MISFTLPADTNLMISQLIDYHKQYVLPRQQNLIDYYNGKHAILNKTVDANMPNNKIVNPYPHYIVTTVQGYFLGQPVRYESKDEKYQKTVSDILDNNNEDDLNLELEKTLSIVGEAFELIYIDEESNICFAQLPALQTIVVYEDTVKPKMKLGLRYYETGTLLKGTGKKQLKVEVYFADRIDYYTQTATKKFVLEETVPHYFGEVPIVHYLNNAECQGDYEQVISLIDEYNKTLSSNSDEFEKFATAYLILKGLEDTTDEEIKTATKKRSLKVPTDADISYLTKQMDTTSVMEHLKEVDKKIHTMTNVPNMADESFASNLSGVAISYKLQGFENLIKGKERKFEQALKNRLKLITTALNLKGNKFDWKAMNFKFDRNLPKNLLENSEIIANLKDTIPAEFLIPLLPFIDDVAALKDALEAAKKEKADALKTQQTNNSQQNLQPMIDAMNQNNTEEN